MIIQKLDPYGCISYRLYRFATTFDKGQYYKDITRLNRDLSKVVVFGQDETGFSKNRENYFKIEPWNGNPEDSLDRYIDFFEALAISNVPDVRTIVQKYQGRDVAETYNKIQGDLYNSMRNQHLLRQKQRSRNILNKIFGRPHGGASGYEDASAKEMPSFEEKKIMLLALRTKEYENAKKMMDEQLEKEKKKQEEYIKENNVTLWDVAVNGPPQLPPSPEQASAIA